MSAIATPSTSAIQPIPAPTLTSRLVSGLLSIKPLAAVAKHQARSMMIKRAEEIGVYWRDEVAELRSHLSAQLAADLGSVQAPDLAYPDYYCTSFHAYEEGNLGWEPALEVEVAAHAVHARIWPDSGAAGDAKLRQSYHAILRAELPVAPQAIVDLGCSVGMSSFALQHTFPQAQITGVDLSPYFLAVATYRDRMRQQGQTWSLTSQQTAIEMPTAVNWVHAPAEATGLAAESADLVSACLMFHELPQSAAVAILQEAHRLLRPGGHLSLMDMNPRSEVYAKMPPYILTLLKSTEPYLDQYFALSLEQAIVDAGFQPPQIVTNSRRHRTVIAKKGC